MSHERTPRALCVDELFGQDVCVPAVRASSRRMCRYTRRSGSGPRRLPWTMPSSPRDDVARRDGWQAPRRVRWMVAMVSFSSGMNDSPGVAGMPIPARGRHAGGFAGPGLPGEGRVLHQARQRGPRRHQRPPRLLPGQPVQAASERPAVLAGEHLELGPGRLIDDVPGGRRREGRHLRSIPRPSPASNERTPAVASFHSWRKLRMILRAARRKKLRGRTPPGLPAAALARRPREGTG